jgi:small subunit ribosomal protein S20
MRSTRDKATAAEMLPKITSMLDKLAKKNIIHPNKAANLKSKLTKQVNGLA